MAQVKLTAVHYRGASQALVDMHGGHIDMIFAAAGIVAEQYRAGNGHDIISDFTEWDVVQLSGAGARRFRDLDFQESDAGVVLTLAGGGIVMFLGLSEDDLDRGGFLLSA